jgi:hypothetical protein
MAFNVNNHFISVDEARSLENKASKVYDKLRELEVEAKIRDAASKGGSSVSIPLTTKEEAKIICGFLSDLRWNAEVETDSEGFVSLVIGW